MFDLLEFLAQLFVFTLGIGILVVAVLYLVDRTQTRHAVGRNFPPLAVSATCSNTWANSTIPGCSVASTRLTRRSG